MTEYNSFMGVNIPRKKWVFDSMRMVFEYYNEKGVVTKRMGIGEVCKILLKEQNQNQIK